MRLLDHPLSIHTPYSDPTPAARIIFHPPLYFYFEYFKHKQSRKKSLINSMYSGPRFSSHHHENLVLPFPPIILKQILETIYDIWKYFSLSLQSMRMLPYFLKNVSQFTSLPCSQSPWLLLRLLSPYHSQHRATETPAAACHFDHFLDYGLAHSGPLWAPASRPSLPQSFTYCRSLLHQLEFKLH